MIDVTCPMCGEIYHADPVHAGKRIQCRRCSFVVPILGDTGAIVQSEPNRREVSQPSPRVRKPAAHSSWSRISWSVGLAGAVITGTLLTLLWHSHTPSDSGPISADAKAESQGAFQREPTKQELPAIPEVVDALPLGAGMSTLPCAPQPDGKSRSLTNGASMMPTPPTKGYSRLEVQNGTGKDAVLSLYDPAGDETIRKFYVQANHSVQTKGIPEGTYQLAYMAGLDWDVSGTFRCDPDYAEFERSLDFKEVTDQEGVRFDTITVTLHPVIGGNVRTKKISREVFLRGDHRTAALRP